MTTTNTKPRETIAAQQAEISRLEGEVVRLTQERDGWKHRIPIIDMTLATVKLIVAASAALDYFTDKADADFDGGHFIGNREASLASELAEAIRIAKGERP